MSIWLIGLIILLYVPIGAFVSFGLTKIVNKIETNRDRHVVIIIWPILIILIISTIWVFYIMDILKFISSIIWYIVKEPKDNKKNLERNDYEGV